MNYLTVATIVLNAGLGALAQIPYSNPELGFVMTVPAGFLGEGEDPLGPATNIACFVSPSTSDRGWIRLCAERQGGSLPRTAQRQKYAWKGAEIDGARFRSEWGPTGEAVEVVVALVPLKKEPILIVAMAPSAYASHAQAALVSTLISLQGDSGALSSTERAERAGEKFGYVGGIIFAIGVGMWIMKRRQKGTRD